MLDVVVYRSGSEWAGPWEAAFIKGLKAHGIVPEQRSKDDHRVSDLAVIWAHRQTALFNMQRKAGKPYLIIERGFVGDRFNWTSLGFNGLNGRATFPPPGDYERTERHFGHLLRPWHGGDYALVMGQVPGDQSIKATNINAWADTQCKRLSDMGWRVKYRPHPMDGRGMAPKGVEVSKEYLYNDLCGAGLVVTFNSNSGVDAVINGCHTVAMDQGSMAWDVAAHDLDETSPLDTRKEWFNRIAWSQWQAHEIESGEAWEHIKQCL